MNDTDPAPAAHPAGTVRALIDTELVTEPTRRTWQATLAQPTVTVPRRREARASRAKAPNPCAWRPRRVPTDRARKPAAIPLARPAPRQAVAIADMTATLEVVR